MILKIKYACIVFLFSTILVNVLCAQNSRPTEKSINSTLNLEADSLSSSAVLLDDSELPSKERPEVLAPSRVWKRSLILPGWGQYTNKQAWKVPLVYALLGGLIWNTNRLTKQYHDYRAAVYNLTNEDLLFGPTPAYLADQTNSAFLRNVRDNARTQRDQMILGTLLAYGLNVLDAYIYAHFRTFDVSDDLSLSPSFQQGPDGLYTAMQLKIQF
jgi:hypothetical protein